MSSLLSERLEPLLVRFEDAWDGPAPPRIEDYLAPPGAPHRLALLVELVYIDLERRLTRGEPVRVEEVYFARFPELSADRAVAVALAAHEFCLRRRREPGLSPAEYLERLPQYRDDLLARLAGGAPAGGEKPTETRQEGLTPGCAGAGDAAPPPGRRFGAYEVLGYLGGGGMGAVYRARHTLLKKEVALKLISGRWAADRDAAPRFLREIEAAGRLEHPNLVRACDAGLVEGRPFLVMELLDGADLAHLLKRHGPWPVVEACEAARQVALGLQHAFEKGLVHRDVKPSNLMLTGAGVVKVLDLGLARLCARQDRETLTRPGHRGMGTPDYIAPEQVLDSGSADIRADLYSLGCTLFHLLTGRPPFGDATHPTAVHKHAAHVSEPPPPLGACRRDVPAELAAVVARLLAKRPECRYRTPAEVAAALEPFARSNRLEALLGGGPASQQKASILLVDDQPGNLLALEAVLGGLGQNLVKAGSGREALRCLLRADFALILMDVRMPGMDGLETAELIRQRPRCQHTPIIFLTAYERTDVQMFKGYSLGAVDYLTKPLVPEVLRSKVAVFVELARKTEQVKHQGELLRRQQDREHERRLAEERQRWEMERLREGAAGEKRVVEQLARATAERGRAEERARELARRQALVNDLAGRALGGSDTGPLLDEAVALVAATVGAEYSVVLELQQDREALVLRAGAGWKEGCLGRTVPRANANGLLGGGPVVVEDLRADERFAGVPFLREHGAVSGVSVLVGRVEQPLGTLGAYASRKGAFTQNDGQFLQAVAHVLAAAIQRRRHETELAKLEGQLAGLTKRQLSPSPAGLAAQPPRPDQSPAPSA